MAAPCSKQQQQPTIFLLAFCLFFFFQHWKQSCCPSKSSQCLVFLPWRVVALGDTCCVLPMHTFLLCNTRTAAPWYCHVACSEEISPPFPVAGSPSSPPAAKTKIEQDTLWELPWAASLPAVLPPAAPCGPLHPLPHQLCCLHGQN